MCHTHTYTHTSEQTKKEENKLISTKRKFFREFCGQKQEQAFALWLSEAGKLALLKLHL
jgi:hypothetical protein